MKDYEALIIVQPDLQDDAMDIAVKEIENVFKKHESQVVEIEKRGKSALSHAIAKKKEGNFFLFKVKCNPGVVKDIGRDLSLNQNVLRNMITIQKKA